MYLVKYALHFYIYLIMKKLALSLVLISLVLSSCGKKEEISVEQVEMETIIYKVPMLEGGPGKYKDVNHGEELWFAMGAMTGKAGVNANGMVQANYFEKGRYRSNLQLNVERAPDGYFYEGWLVKDGFVPVSLSHLRSRFGDVRHSLNFEADQDLREYTTVWVTMEKDDGNPQPGKKVAEGILVHRER